METIQELTYIAPGQVEWRERPRPAIEGPGQALVRPLAVSRCDLDLAVATTGMLPGPFALGHECVGEVVEVGDAVRTVGPGDRVVVPFQVSCGACARCQAGQTGNCESVPRLAAFGLAPLCQTDYGGAVSDRIRIPYADAMLLPLPGRLDPVAAAPLADNAVDGLRAVRAALARKPGARVLVAGGDARSVALYAVAGARALGAGEVVYVDDDRERAAVAERLGARVIAQPPAPGLRVGRFPIVVDGTAREPGLRFCLDSTDLDGVCTCVGIFWQEVSLPLPQMYTRGIELVTGRVHARRELPAALALAESAAFALAPVATSVVPWAAAAEAWCVPGTKLVVHREAA